MKIQEAHELIEAIAAEEDNEQYRLAWGLPLVDESFPGLAFEENIEARLQSVVGQYAVSQGISWEEANGALIQHKINVDNEASELKI